MLQLTDEEDRGKPDNSNRVEQLQEEETNYMELEESKIAQRSDNNRHI